MSFKEIKEDSNEVINGEATVLHYGFTKEEIKGLKKYFAIFNVEKYIHVTDEMTQITIEKLLDGSTEKNVAKPINEKLVLLKDVENNLIRQLVVGFKETGIKQPLFAVLTETNKKWSVENLISDLSEERAMIEKMMRERRQR